MNRFVSRLGYTTLVLAAGVVAHAQTSTTGVVNGVVKDKSGATVAGASVVASSAQTTRTATTGADGSFRLGLLNAGEWTIKVSKAGLQSNSQKLTIYANQATAASFSLDKEAGAVVVVSATSANLDLSTTTTGLNTSMETLNAVPVGRDINTLALLSPGVSNSGFAGGPSISGASGAENSYVLDGLVTTDFRTGFQGAALPTDFVDQVDIQTGGFKPEYSALGGVFNVVTKSGSNDFRGSSWATFDARGMEAKGKASDRGFFAAPETFGRYDIGVEAGGAIIKDKFFYWAGINGTKTTGEEVGNVIGNADGSNLISDASKTDDYKFVGKLQYFLSQDQQLNLTVNSVDNTFSRDNGYPARGNANFNGVETKNTTLSASLGYDWSITPSLYLTTKLGFTKLTTKQTPSDSVNSLVVDSRYFMPASTASVAGPGFAAAPQLAGQSFLSGGFDIYTAESTNKTLQLKADLSWYLGNHGLKFGVSQVGSKYLLNQQQSGGARITINSSGSNVHHQRNNTNAEVETIFQAFYAQDTWEALPGFRVAFGFRFETQELKDFTGKTFLKFDNLQDYTQPRLGLTWDVNNDGKTKISANYAKYFEAIPQRLSIRVFANETYLRNYYFRSTGKFVYDGNNPNHYGTVNGGFTDANADLRADFATPFAFDPVAEGTKLPERSEYILGVDHTFANGFTVGVHGKHRVLKNVIEDSVITDFFGNYYDPGASSGDFGYFGQAILWNPGRSAAWTARPNSGTPGVRYDINPGNTPGGTLFDEVGNTYDSVDLTIDKKSERDFLSFSWTISRLQGNYEGLVSSSNGQADANITASFDYYPYSGYGLLPLDRTHSVKLYGSHRFSVGQHDLNIGINSLFQSGTPNSKLTGGDTTMVTYPDGSTGPQPDVGGYGNAIFENFRQGQFGRNPWTAKVDFHADFVWRISGKKVLTPSIDIFNLFNTRKAIGAFQGYTDQSGNIQPNWNHPNGFQRGRQFRFGVKFAF